MTEEPETPAVGEATTPALGVGLQRRVMLHHGNALRLLLDLETDSVDAVITDPPYSSGGLMQHDRIRGQLDKYTGTYGKQPDLPEFSGDARSYGYWCSLWLTEALRVVKTGGICAVFADWRQLPTTTDALQAGGWVWRGVVPWYKPGGRPTQGRYANQCEYVVWGTNGRRPLTALDGKALPGFYKANSPRERDHITQKPLSVMRKLVQIVPPGGVVLDLFAGSGTTAEACKLEGRSCIGFEIEPHFVEVARSRVEAVEQAPGLFDAA